MKRMNRSRRTGICLCWIVGSVDSMLVEYAKGLKASTLSIAMHDLEFQYCVCLQRTKNALSLDFQSLYCRSKS